MDVKTTEPLKRRKADAAERRLVRSFHLMDAFVALGGRCGPDDAARLVLDAESARTLAASVWQHYD